MLPGFSSKNNQIGGGKKKLKSKKHFHNDDGENEFNEILLQYNLERMHDQQQHDFDRCDMHRDAYPFASSLSKNTDDESLFEERHDASPSSYPDDEDGDEEDQDGGESSESIEIRICTYQINTSCKLPFIEYLMILSDEKNGKKVFEFPKFDYISSKRKGCPYTECAHERLCFLSLVFSEIIKLTNNMPLRVFDACAGWGDRLIMSMVLKAERYVGVEPNSKSNNGFNRAITLLGNIDKHQIILTN